MTSFFKRLFGKTENKTQPNEQTVHPPDISFSVKVSIKESETTAPLTAEIKKSYDIGEIKKQCTQIKDKEGFLNSVNFVKTFISENHIEFSELISLLKKIVPYMKKEKTISEVDNCTYINSQIEKYPEKENIENLTVIADILYRMGNSYALKYLENKLGEVASEKKINVNYFDAIILLSNYYLEDKKSDKAFQTIRKATSLVTNFKERLDYVSKQSIIAERSAIICLKGYQKPADYLHYYITYFILSTSMEFFSMGILGPHSTFFFWKEKYFNEGWFGFVENDDFNAALIDLKIDSHKNELSNHIYNFTFNELPLLIGFPKEYLNEETNTYYTENCFELDLNTPKWKKLNNAIDLYNNKSFDAIGVINKFVSTTIKRYYDLENIKSN